MEIKTSEYSVWEDLQTNTVFFEGTMRLSGTPAYDEISRLLEARLAATTGTLTLDLSGLELMNSSGINLLAKFTIRVRTSKLGGFVIRGSKDYPWQSKSLYNLSRLYPALVLEVK